MIENLNEELQAAAEALRSAHALVLEQETVADRFQASLLHGRLKQG